MRLLVSSSLQAKFPGVRVLVLKLRLADISALPFVLIDHKTGHAIPARRAADRRQVLSYIYDLKPMPSLNRHQTKWPLVHPLCERR